MDEFQHISLFTGIGGFDLAARRLGWNNVAHCEKEESKRKILIKNFPNSESHEDIRDFDGRKYRDTIDVLSGGFPCQDTSIANQSCKTNGAQGIKGERSSLWNEYARLVGEIRPGAIVFENSPMLLNRGFEQILFDMAKLGYDVEWRLFYATQFGFPHLRERLFGVAYSSSIRWKGIIEKSGILQRILPERTPRQAPVPIPIERFNSRSSYENVRMDDGFSRELDKVRIHGCGNAVIPEIAYQIFNALETSYRTINQINP